MAGHSKWAQIKRAKGVNDVKRGVLFSKLGAAISVTARNGADPETNFQLRLAIDKARAANMPKENIDRAIERAASKQGAVMEELVFEIYGPGGTALLVEAASDNRNRTAGDIRAVVNKHGAKLAETGSVAYLFEKKGLIVVVTDKADEVGLAAIDAGAEDVSSQDGRVFIYTKPENLESIRQQLLSQNLVIEEASLVKEALSPINVSDSETADKIIRFCEALEDLDDVVKVEGNFELADS